MGIKEANITLDNEWNTYYAGQAVTGRVEYVFDKPKKVRGIHVRFKGEAATSWNESKQQEDAQGKTETVDENYSAREEYFNIVYYLLGSSTSTETEIPAGRHVYNFTCTLPPVLPSSFEGEHGYIRYTVLVTLDRPWKFDQENKLAFTVLNPMDLNQDPSYLRPIHMQMEKTFCCLCCASGPLSVDARAPAAAYCPGQAVPVAVDIDNRSNVQLELVKVFLRKLVTYRSTTPSRAVKKTEEVLATAQQGPAPAGGARRFDLALPVPAAPPSHLVNCGIIDLDYDIMVECAVSGPHMNLTSREYVTIGTVPLLGPAAQGPAAPGPAAPGPAAPGPAPQYPGGDVIAPSAPPSEGPDGPGGLAGPGWVAPNSLYPTLDQPVLTAAGAAAAVRDAADTEHTRYQQHYAPHYPVYAAPPPLPQ